MILLSPEKSSAIWRGACFALAWLLASQAWAANGTGQHLEYFALSYRSGNELVPVVKPLLGGGSIVSTSDKQLVLRAPPARLIEIRRVIAEFDVPRRRLQITFKETGETPGGGTSYSTQALDAERGAQSVQAVEGTRAFIQIGQSVPVTSAMVSTGPRGAYVGGSTEYHELNRGFHAMAWVLGDQVTVEISASRDLPSDVSAGGGSASTQSISTTVSGKLGSWIEIGSQGAQRQSGASSVSTRDLRAGGGVQRVLLKVEEIH
jgi:hypothetical protein